MDLSVPPFIISLKQVALKDIAFEIFVNSYQAKTYLYFAPLLWLNVQTLHACNRTK